MSFSRITLRSVVLVAVLLAAVAFIGWKSARLFADPSFFPPDDFVEYYAAGRLTVLGQNPYDGELLLPLERAAGRDTDEPVMMWNPPWTLSLAMPIGFFEPSSARIAQLLWLAVSLALVVACADQLWVAYGGPNSRRWVSWLLAICFAPTLFVLQAGQIGPFILLGIAGFLLAERAGRYWLAGACGVLMAIKPHLVYLFWIALAMWAMRRPLPDRWKIIAGGLLVGLIATAIPLACNPHVLGQYWDAMTNRTPEHWKSPTLGSLLRELFGQEHFGLQFVPTLIGLVWLAAYGWANRRREWDWLDQMPLVLLVSFVTASYGAWPFDLVILLPAVIQIAAGLTRRGDLRGIVLGVALFATINGAALAMNRLQATSDRFVWMAPTLLVGYVLFRSRTAAQ
jgi:Glycosyltransferase family 87